jgi:flagellar basal body-associated protein FliL
MSRGLIIAVVVLLAVVLAMGAVVWYLRRDARQEQLQSASVAPPVAEAPAQVTLVLANDADGSLLRSAVNVSLPQSSANRPREVMKALVLKSLEPGTPNPLPQ